MGTTKTPRAPRSASSPTVAKAPRFTVLEALEDAIESLEQRDSGDWDPDTESFESVLIEYRKAVAWAKERVTLFILTDEDAQAYAAEMGVATPLTQQELRQIQIGVQAGLGSVQSECLEAAIECATADRTK